MKRHLINLMVFGVAAMMMLASCKKDNGNDGNVPEKGFRATVEQIGDNGNKGSRTHINPENWNDGTTWPVLWTEGDQILVYNGSITTFQLQSGANTDDGIFLPAGGEEFDYQSGPFCAVYSPEASSLYSIYSQYYPELMDQIVPLFFNGTSAMVSVPSTQVYRDNSFAEGSMPMVAFNDGQTLQFKNLAGGLCFPIMGVGTVTYITVESLDANDKVSGYFMVDHSDPTLPLTSTNTMGGGQRSVSLDCPSGGVTLDENNPTYFTVMVAPGTLEKGFKVTAVGSNGVLYEKTVDWSADPKVGFIPRGVIRKLNTNLEIAPRAPRVRSFPPSFITTNSAYCSNSFEAPEVDYTFGYLVAKAEDLSNPKEDLVLDGTNVMHYDATLFTEEEFPNDYGIRQFYANITGLDEDQVYWVRAYVKLPDYDMVSYTKPAPFATRKDYANDYDGLLSGVFSVAPGKQVQFSMGNLQYQASTGTWRFAEGQFECVGGDSWGSVYSNGMHPDVSLNGVKSNNNNISNNYDQWIDLFGWGTSGYNHGAVCYQPWSTSTQASDYYSGAALSGQADWGYNAIANGGNTENSGWRTLQGGDNGGNTNEWDYLLNLRPVTYRYAQILLHFRASKMSTGSLAEVANIDENLIYNDEIPTNYMYDGWPESEVPGVIVFPDNFVWPSELGNGDPLIFNGEGLYGYTNHRKPCIYESTWSVLEHYGAVFLPHNVGEWGTAYQDMPDGYYWSGTGSNSDNAVGMRLYYRDRPASSSDNKESIEIGNYGKNTRRAVRLVKDVN